MKNWKKVILGMALSFMVFFTAIGYAALTDTLSISGTLNASAPEDIFITKIEPINGAPTAEKTGLRTMETTVSGGVGDTITYAIEVKNNTDDTYVYAGASEPFTAWTEDEDGYSPSYEIANAYSTGPLIGARETLTIYVQYTFMSAIETPTVAPVEFYFKEPIYTIEYINNSHVYDTRYVYNNESAVETKNDTAAGLIAADMGDLYEVEYWINTGSTQMDEIAAGNTADVILYPSFKGIYTAIFVDLDGNIVTWTEFKTDNHETVENIATNLSTTATDELPVALPEVENCTFTPGTANWEVHTVTTNENGTTTTEKFPYSEYDFSQAQNITLYPLYMYNGDVQLIPVDNNGDGITDEYQVGGFKDPDAPTNLVEIPESVNGKNVTSINANAFSDYDDLHAVKIPSTVETIGSKILPGEENISGRQTVTIYYEGTPAQWKTNMDALYRGNTGYEALNTNISTTATTNFASNWDAGLGAGSRVFFLNEQGKVDLSKGYWELYRYSTGITSAEYTWVFHDHAYTQAAMENCATPGMKYHKEFVDNWFSDDIIDAEAMTDYDGACTCNSCNGATRPDASYWTEEATTSTFGLRETTPEETTPEETTAPEDETTP